MNLYSPSKEQLSKEWDFTGQNKSCAKASIHTQKSPETVSGRGWVGNTEAL